MEPSSHPKDEEVTSTIPHMHLFMYLKRRFPGLKDADITDAIQRFGLDKTRCEEELGQRNQDQHRVYYSPWNRSKSTSDSSNRDSPSNGTSPLSPSDTRSYTQSPLQNGVSSLPTLFSTPVNQCFVGAGVEESPNKHLPEYHFHHLDISKPPETKVVYSCATTAKESTTPADYTNGKYPFPQLPENDFRNISNGFTNLKVEESISAPVVLDARETFFCHLSPNRRKSEDTAGNLGRNRNLASPNNQVYDQASSCDHLDRHSEKFRNPGELISSSLAAVAAATTMSSPSDTFSPVTPQTCFSTSPLSDQKIQQQQQLPAAVQEQVARKERLKEELSRRLEEKAKLVVEVQSLIEQLDTREKSQLLEVIKSKKEIELIQLENSRLQYVCDEMEMEILASGESPKIDQEGRVGRSRQPSTTNDLTSSSIPFQDSPTRIPPQQHLLRAISTTSSNSAGVAGSTTPLVPVRIAPSPPSICPVSPPANVLNSGHADLAPQRPTTIGSDEGGNEWSCSKCTFINSRYLKECEICGFHRFSVGTPPHLSPQNHSSSAPNPGGPCYCHHRHHNLNHEHRNAGELQDIHIQVRHQNLHSPSKRVGCDSPRYEPNEL